MCLESVLARSCRNELRLRRQSCSSKNGEARRLIEELSSLARAHNADGVTARQLNFIRRLVKKAGHSNQVLEIIAEEAGGVKHIAELTKQQASDVIDWLLSQAPKDESS